MKEESDFSFNKISIIGVGLIGGSLGLALKEKKPNFKIVGIDKQEIIEKAIAREAIDEGTVNLEEGIEEADIVIIATPVKTILNILTQINPFLKKGCLVTDTGSTKQQIVQKANKVLSKDVFFIGGHPMAGSEKCGIESANPHLFQDRTYILTPTKKSNLIAIEKIFSLIKMIDANRLILDPLEHDRIVGAVSHLPQIIAVSLINTIGELALRGNNNNYFKAIGEGFKDMTRITSSPYKIWEDICETNQENILKMIQEFRNYLGVIEEKLKNDPSSLKEEFQKASQIRGTL
ncbi:prephenate dehydrogenase/arogenate dehydrogenase family protein [bacterium]|nr:prephenate dehydrogenase/arogenate dehydrogenase family protein [Candidatus Atribacteria bacterium]MBU1291253.1 prephenate dehydrogenase/arogenate dehydrogenase family protein [bacterium]MBU1428298.1 prephenate dehydrogenase/arogenate dehydrogenase family protein [bacterium]MBU2440362.1 prephenate dehydrogenase/arogenate dehydrogenase family protein [bacterium]MBU4048004.1 prephenate dehydrogenase/arogenate dehydrogenase family protein [bacterium]